MLQLHATNVTVQDTVRYTQWKLPYAAIVADPAQRTEQAPPMPPRPFDASAFKLGDPGCFTDKHLRERIGIITRINFFGAIDQSITEPSLSK